MYNMSFDDAFDLTAFTYDFFFSNVDYLVPGMYEIGLLAHTRNPEGLKRRLKHRPLLFRWGHDRRKFVDSASERTATTMQGVVRTTDRRIMSDMETKIDLLT